MWQQDPIVHQLIRYMEGKGCMVTLFADRARFENFGVVNDVRGEDINNALHAAYRVEWDPKRIAKRFERYLIDLHNRRKNVENFNENEGL